jgi:hypothetical protein
MKQKDILLIVVVAIISGAISLIVSNMLFGTPEKRSQEVEVIDPISSQFPMPNKEYFNAQAENPAQSVEIGTSTNPNPFDGQ